MRYKVTQQDGTEPSFNNKYHDNKADGIYVDIVSGEPLFTSTDKFDSGTDWPSFTRPLVPENIVEHEDRKFLWCEPRCAANMLIPILDTCSPMDQRPPDCDIASIRPL